MARNFGIMSGPASLRGASTDRPASSGSYAPRDLNPPLPSGSILKSFEVSEPSVHKFKAFENALLVVGTAAAFVVAGFILLFVKT